MIRKLFRLIIIVLMIIGIILGISIAIKNSFPNISLKKAEKNVVNKIQSTNAEIIEIYTYGRALNLKGRIPKVLKDNVESVKILLTDGLDYEKTYNLKYSIEENYLVFDTTEEINTGINLDKLEIGSQYYILLRLKLNNSVNPKFYSFANCDELNYYSLTKEGTNKLSKIQVVDKKYKKNEYKFLTITTENAELPEEIYDIVIDSGHGGKDTGNKNDKLVEADITLEYAKLLKTYLEEKGFKVKLTRDDENSSSYNEVNMYDEDGRITTACKTRAKLMISFHINNGDSSLSGFEIYCPPNSNFNLAKKIAKNINDNTNLRFSNSNNSKKADGVYLRNYTEAQIKDSAKTAERKGYKPYNITTDTAFLYTIREVGTYGTGAYVDGRNKDYNKNEFYNGSYGIECYQLELGYMKTDSDILISEKDNITKEIANAIEEYYK